MAEQKKIPTLRWEGAGWDVRGVAAKDKAEFASKGKDDKAKASRAALHDKCTALVAEADGVAPTPVPVQETAKEAVPPADVAGTSDAVDAEGTGKGKNKAKNQPVI